MLWQKRLKAAIWSEYRDAEEPHLFKAEINTMMTLICVMEEAWDELTDAVGSEAKASLAVSVGTASRSCLTSFLTLTQARIVSLAPTLTLALTLTLTPKPQTLTLRRTFLEA